MRIQETEYGEGISEDAIQRYHFVIYASEELLKIPPHFRYIARRHEAAVERAEPGRLQYIDYLKGNITRIYRGNKDRCFKEIMNYAHDLEKAFYAAKEIYTMNTSDRVKEWLERVFFLGRMGNFLPLLIACWIKFRGDESKLVEILSLIETYIFRVYVIGRRRADTGRSSLYELAHHIYTETIDHEQLVEKLKELIWRYERDARFEEHLRSKDFYKARVRPKDIRYLLFEYERYLCEKAREPFKLSIDCLRWRKEDGRIIRPNVEIEHIWPEILPRELESKLSEEEKRLHEEYKHKLGNLTLASPGWNSSMGNKPFIEKKDYYRDSSFRVQRELVKYEKWGPEEIEQRENEIIMFAKRRWSIGSPAQI